MQSQISENHLWQKTLLQLEKNLSPQNFSTWIKPIKFIGLNKEEIHLEVPNRFILDWLIENYNELIQETISQICTISYLVKYSIKGTSSDRTNKKNINNIHVFKFDEQENEKTEPKNINLNEKYTFEGFVSGSSNQFAFAAAMAVANNPATTYT